MTPMTDKLLAKVKDDLRMLNCKIQVERNYEARHQAQRVRLEAERGHLQAFLDFHEVAQRYASPGASPKIAAFDAAGINGAPAVVSTFTDAASVAAAEAAGQAQQKHRPEGIPSTPTMVKTAIEGANGRGLRPREVIAFIREKYWPSVRAADVSSAMWRMAHNGKLTSENGLYRLNGTTALVD